MKGQTVLINHLSMHHSAKRSSSLIHQSFRRLKTFREIARMMYFMLILLVNIYQNCDLSENMNSIELKRSEIRLFQDNSSVGRTRNLSTREVPRYHDRGEFQDFVYNFYSEYNCISIYHIPIELTNSQNYYLKIKFESPNPNQYSEKSSSRLSVVLNLLYFCKFQLCIWSTPFICSL